jgi:hypothetical protein
MNSESKIKILKAYFDGRINKDEMKFLFKVGIIIPPITWIYSSGTEQRRQEKKRDLVDKILGYKTPKVKWV